MKVMAGTSDLDIHRTARELIKQRGMAGNDW